MQLADITIDKVTSQIKVLSGPFADTVFTFGEVKFPEGDEPIMSYEYSVIEKLPDDVPAFEKALGDLMVELITISLANNDTAFTGGV